MQMTKDKIYNNEFYDALSEIYVNDRFLPDKAIDLIDEAASKKKITTSTSSRNNRGRPATTGKTSTVMYSDIYCYVTNKLDSNKTITVSNSSAWSTTNK